jgi:replication-associated recombination protein RarA
VTGVQTCALPIYNGADFTEATLKKLYGNLNLLSMQTDDPIVILNEIDELDRRMQAKFRAWMDEWSMMKFVVTTNAMPGVAGVVEQIMPALVSRFTSVELRPPSLDDWLPRAQAIFAAEGHAVSTPDLKLLLGTYNGDVRDMLPQIERALVELRTSQPVARKPKPVLQVFTSQQSK